MTQTKSQITEFQNCTLRNISKDCQSWFRCL